MRLVLFSPASGAGLLTRVGVQFDAQHVADVSAALADLGQHVYSMRQFLELGEKGREAAEHAVATKLYHRSAADIRIRAPIYDCEKIICVGMNYVDHCTEQNVPIPKEPLLFAKFPSCIIGDGEPLVAPPETSELDYEVELTIVIGKKGRRITKEKAHEHIAGFTVAHDVSARDYQLKRNGGQWLLGKAFDGFAPIGPAIVTTDEIGDVNNLRLRTLVNGKVLQDGNTKELVHKTDDIVAYASKFFTLQPGDLILTGTPPGVGCFRKPEPIWLKAGDVVTVEIENIGAITNTVTAEKV